MNLRQTDPHRPDPGRRTSGGPILQVGEDRHLEAIERLVAPPGTDNRLHARKFLDYARETGLSLEYLWSNLDEQGRITETVLAVPNAGRTAMMFTTRPASPEQAASVGRVIDHACGKLTEGGLHLVQSLPEPADLLDREAFLAGRFVELAILSYFQRPVPRPGKIPQPVWPVKVRVGPYDESRRDDLVEILNASYEQTLDCPGLTGLRDTHDILEGHRATGAFEPALWTLLYVEDQPSGALLLNPAAGQETVELVYVGLALRARGKGLGRSLLRHGLGLLAGREERTVTVAADERNAPALALYRSEGFHSIGRRVAMIRSLRRRPSAQSEAKPESAGC
ncbi:MAG: GNAT family N-acetyltransferase [Phycisphaerales bacterium]|nr:MAG: GNAT family N-acetyltransferase [Phycisphaerales bacterium]